jgi:hypothetical protein
MFEAITWSEVDREIEVFDGVPADRLLRVKRTPSLPVSASQDVRVQSVDRLAVAQTNHAVADAKYAVIHFCLEIVRWTRTIDAAAERVLTAGAKC